ncbi:Imm8 family immunity protein [Marinobacter sp. OP 3.4]|uniref:Imm8 family immunity protein n=1 Tax=Marinobacter sp. OP 3.4 TaxID=3076501 RepID=UPI002E225D61
MNAELKRLHSPDIFNLESYHPEDPRKFVFLLQLLAAIRDFLSECSGENWSEIAQKVSRLGNWEFDGYRM